MCRQPCHPRTAASHVPFLPMVELLLERAANPALLDDEHHNTPAGWAKVASTVTNNPACLAVAERLAHIT
jgi:hypothetical protein